MLTSFSCFNTHENLFSIEKKRSTEFSSPFELEPLASDYKFYLSTDCILELHEFNLRCLTLFSFFVTLKMLIL